jgi:hypothetical protein
MQKSVKIYIRFFTKKSYETQKDSLLNILTPDLVPQIIGYKNL